MMLQLQQALLFAAAAPACAAPVAAPAVAGCPAGVAAAGSGVDLFVEPAAPSTQRDPLVVAPADDGTATGGAQPARRGSVARPFRTLTQARDAVRALRARCWGGVLPAGGVTVHLRGGVHTLARPLVLGLQDSGVTYRAHRGDTEPVLISGGLAVPWATFVQAPGRPRVLQANLTALLDAAVGGHATLPNDPWGEVKVGGADGPPVATDLAELFCGGKPMHLARWPNVHANGSTQWAYTGAGLPHNCSTDCAGFALRRASGPGPPAPAAARLRQWAQEAAENYPFLHGYWQYDWRDTYTPLVGTNATAGSLEVSDPSLLAKAALGARFYAINLNSELDAPGEYYIERSNKTAAAAASIGMLYFYPPAGRCGTDNVYISMAQSLVVLEEGASHITFEGLRFEHCRGTAVGGAGHTSHISLRNCTVANTGGGGDSRRGGGVDLTGTHNVVENCTVYGTAGTGISLRGGNHVSLSRGDNLLQDSHIYRTSRWFRSYHPAVAWAGVGNTFRKNKITDLPHAAFFGGGNDAVCTESWAGKPAWWPADRGVCGANDNMFEGNVIEDVAHECSDTGAFYTCGQEGTGRINLNNSLINNTFRRIRNRGVLRWRGDAALRKEGTLGVQSPFVQAIYFDDGMSGWFASDNKFEDVQNAFLINGGTQNVATRNHFVDVDHCVWLSVEYSDEHTYANLLNVSVLPAWQKYKNFGGAAPRHSANWGLTDYGSYDAFHAASAKSRDNLFQNNTYCRASLGFCQCCVGSDSSSFRNNSNSSASACSYKTDDRGALRMRELGVYDMMSEETTPFLWFGKLMLVEKIGGNTIILPKDQRQPTGSYFRIREQVLLGHGTNDVAVPLVPGSRFLSYVSGYVDETSNTSRPTLWVFGTNDCIGDSSMKVSGTCTFNTTPPHAWIPCGCHPNPPISPNASFQRSEIWALWSSDPQLSEKSWQKKKVLTLPVEVPVFNTDVTAGPSGAVMATETVRMTSGGGNGFYSIFAVCYLCGADLSHGWQLLDMTEHFYNGNDHSKGHGFDFGDPTIRYLPSDQHFYIVPATPMRDGRAAPVPPGPYPCCFVQWVARSADLMQWQDATAVDQNVEPIMGWPGPHLGLGPHAAPGAGDTTVAAGSVMDVHGSAVQKEICHNKTDNINRSDGDFVELPVSFTAQLGLVGPAVYAVWISGDQVVLGFGAMGIVVNATLDQWLQSYFLQENSTAHLKTDDNTRAPTLSFSPPVLVVGSGAKGVGYADQGFALDTTYLWSPREHADGPPWSSGPSLFVSSTAGASWKPGPKGMPMIGSPITIRLADDRWPVRDLGQQLGWQNTFVPYTRYSRFESVGHTTYFGLDATGRWRWKQVNETVTFDLGQHTAWATGKPDGLYAFSLRQCDSVTLPDSSILVTAQIQWGGGDPADSKTSPVSLVVFRATVAPFLRWTLHGIVANASQYPTGFHGYGEGANENTITLLPDKKTLLVVFRDDDQLGTFDTDACNYTAVRSSGEYPLLSLPPSHPPRCSMRCARNLLNSTVCWVSPVATPSSVSEQFLLCQILAGVGAGPRCCRQGLSARSCCRSAAMASTCSAVDERTRLQAGRWRPRAAERTGARPRCRIKAAKTLTSCCGRRARRRWSAATTAARAGASTRFRTCTTLLSPPISRTSRQRSTTPGSSHRPTPRCTTPATGRRSCFTIWRPLAFARTTPARQAASRRSGRAACGP